MHSGDTSRAYDWGLRCRPVEQTVAATWAWLADVDAGRAAPPPYRPDIGLDPGAESALLAQWARSHRSVAGEPPRSGTMAAMPTVAPYGSWVSPISAADLARGEHPVQPGCFVGPDFWWSELVPSEQGRYAVLRRSPDGTVTTVLPAPWNARSRVHEYGGAAWTVHSATARWSSPTSPTSGCTASTPGRTLRSRSRPAPAAPAALRYADLALVTSRPGEVWCVREVHATAPRSAATSPPSRSTAAPPPTPVPSGRSPAARTSSSSARGSRPTGGGSPGWPGTTRSMPWDGTELRVARPRCGRRRQPRTAPCSAVDGRVGAAAGVGRRRAPLRWPATAPAGGTCTAPTSPAHRLRCARSRGGLRRPAVGASARASYAILPDGRLATIRTLGGRHPGGPRPGDRRPRRRRPR